MSYKEVLAKVQESGLPFSETKFNGSKAIKVAFEECVTPQRYADEGDNINNYQNPMWDKSEKYIKASGKEEQLKYVINYIKDK